MGSTAPIETTVRYVTTVDDLSAAWAFVMEHLERVGPDPAIEIRPIRIMPVGDMVASLDGKEERWLPRQFEVSVGGTTSGG